MIYIALMLFVMFGLQAGVGNSRLMDAAPSEAQQESNVPKADQAMLIDATKKGDCNKIAGYLDEHENVIPKGLLQLALKEKQKEVVTLLLTHNVDVNERCAGTYPIHAAIVKYPEMLEALIAKGACVHSITKKEGATPLHLACIFENEQACATLIKHGARVNARDHDHRTPLHKIAWKGNIALATQLLQAEASLDVLDEEQATPLHRAIVNKHPRLALDFIARGAKLNMQTNNGEAELHYAVRHYEADVFKALLDNGANPNIVNHDQESVLYVAAQTGCVDAVKMLIPFFDDINLMTKDGATPLLAALWNAHEQVALLLLQAKADPNAGQGPHRPLHLAANRNLIEAARLLLQKGADPLARDKQGNLPSFYAKTNAMTALLTNTEQR